jgi:glutamate/tyrosine decarboxylase-like PLP-dependent enzyme
MKTSNNPAAPDLLLDPATRTQLWTRLIEIIENYTNTIAQQRVTPELAPQKIRALLAACDFKAPMDAIEALDFVAKGLTEYQTHTPHPRYYGLFNPAPATASIAADALVAAFNPQMAAWSHSPMAVEVEQHLIRCFGEWFGYEAAHIDGTFASGGAEANHTALLTALTDAFPDYPTRGVRALAAQPVFYASSESHHSFLKAARISGIGVQSMRQIEVDDQLRMIPAALESAIAQDRAAQLEPFLVVATAGTTNAGVIDPLASLAKIAARHRLWYHVDAAWGGAAALVPELSPLLDGIAAADSITFDAHKWLSVPMGAGIYLTRHIEILQRTFRTQTAYMPREAAGLDVVDPHLHTMQWSRRFTGLKVFLSLLVAGRAGYERAIRHQTAMGGLLREQLRANGWHIDNETLLPVICFSDPGGADPHAIVMRIVSSGEAWISTTQIKGRAVLRACITNYRTEPSDIQALVDSLNQARVFDLSQGDHRAEKKASTS